MITRGYTLVEVVHDMDVLIESTAGQETIFDQGSSWLDLQHGSCDTTSFGDHELVLSL